MIIIFNKIAIKIYTIFCRSRKFIWIVYEEIDDFYDKWIIDSKVNTRPDFNDYTSHALLPAFFIIQDCHSIYPWFLTNSDEILGTPKFYYVKI
jgi:hypothetical protein